ncbi:sigma-54 interaction domain-containing protein [Dyadobacter fermentans]|uniref:Sigma 54 interacting domain protein n=1 Tax=Dyadobacter fermentans (strain ATCC 700827 / DSM 18053 / CIP 107007 / KCTC 52180 / NS114) TaxID=471854 RepID=C6VTN7_DYAFD|nr:sigma 54-interacting transcriptional regulator [Dyadobacter fermentans]ACT92980.1 Sigma 54 interacting domain protein [Dyadobacter fermentans DSM 18053]
MSHDEALSPNRQLTAQEMAVLTSLYRQLATAPSLLALQQILNDQLKALFHFTHCRISRLPLSADAHVPAGEASEHEVLAIALHDESGTWGHLRFYSDREAISPAIPMALPDQVSSVVSLAIANIVSTEKLSRQLEEIKHYQSQLEEQNAYLLEEAKEGFSYDDIIGSSGPMQRVFQLLSQVSFTNSTVLLLGETGTGKELVARAIHNSSARKDRLMVRVNCAAIPAHLIESELFGHEKGSFTGAFERRIGKFELANQATLFLDEIGEMPLDMQAKLLRAIQEREIERIGGKGVIKVDVRIIAATNRNLLEEVQQGRFRSDLFYRLHVFPITLPPLRERTGDISLLAKQFVGRFAKNNGKSISRISSNVMKALLAYPWPGNVRELEHQMERCVLLARDHVIRDVLLPSPTQSGHAPAAGIYTKTHEENEREYIIRVLNQCNGKIYGPGGAAQLLNLKVGTLNSKIKKLGISKEQIILRNH